MRLTKFAVTGLLLLAGTAQATTLVVRATGPSSAAYPPGKTLPDTARIMLKANDIVMLLDARGTRTLRGPGNFSALSTASADTNSNGTALAALVEQRGDRRVRIGAVRSADSVQRTPPGIWYVDTSKAGTVCVADPAHAMLWRAGSDVAATTTISGAPGASAKIDWNPGEAVQPWPAALPLTAGARYRVVGTGAPVDLKVAIVTAGGTDPQAIAKTLITAGCSNQVDLLLAKVDAANAANASK